MKRTTKLRELIHATEILQMPCCHDCLSAKVLEQAGFKAIAAAGYGLAGSLLGMPDIGVLTASEMITQYKNICSAVDLPVFVDIDTGFGDVNNVYSHRQGLSEGRCGRALNRRPDIPQKVRTHGRQKCCVSGGVSAQTEGRALGQGRS